MTDAPVLYEVKEKIATITINRPENRNSMDTETLAAFRESVQKVKADKSVRCVIVTGSGKSFCAGADFKNRMGGDEPTPNLALQNVYGPFLDIGEIKPPTIAALNGHAIGGGFGLALICDIRVAANEAKYGANFARLGLHTGMAVSYMLPQIVGLPTANELLFTGRLINGKQSKEIGLVNYSVEASEVYAKAWELAKEIAACAPVAVQMIKRSVYRGLEWRPEEAAEFEAHCQSRTSEMDDAREGIAALLEKREPNFQGK
jgi:enoyl-CoA hydratase/carnithine racemase